MAIEANSGSVYTYYIYSIAMIMNQIAYFKVAIMEKCPNMKNKIIPILKLRNHFVLVKNILTTIIAYDWMRSNWMIRRQD